MTNVPIVKGAMYALIYISLHCNTLLLELQATYVVPWDTVLSKTPLETGAVKKLKLLRSRAGISTVVQAHEKKWNNAVLISMV